MKLNIFGGEGYLTDEQRKMPLEHGCEYFTFKTCMDLSSPIEIRQYGTATEQPLTWYSIDIANFISWWTREVAPTLNGFSGFNNVRFIPIGFTVVEDWRIVEAREKILFVTDSYKVEHKNFEK